MLAKAVLTALLGMLPVLGNGCAYDSPSSGANRPALAENQRANGPSAEPSESSETRPQAEPAVKTKKVTIAVSGMT